MPEVGNVSLPDSITVIGVGSGVEITAAYMHSTVSGFLRGVIPL